MLRFNVIDIIKGIFTAIHIIDFFVLYKELKQDYIVVANINIPKIDTDVYIHIHFKVRIFFISDEYKIAIRLY